MLRRFFSILTLCTYILGMLSPTATYANGAVDFGGQSVVPKPTKTVLQRYILLQKNDETLHPRTEFVRLNAVFSGVSPSTTDQGL